MSEINVIKQEVTEIKKYNEKTEQKIETLTAHYEQISLKATKLSNDNAANCSKIKQLEDKIDDLNRQSCAFKLEIRNIPSTERESAHDLHLVVSNLLKTLKIQTQISDIRSIRRLPGRPDVPRPIVIEATTMKMKQNILQEIRNFNKTNRAAKLSTTHLNIPGFENSPRPVYVGEHLTYKTKSLFYKARAFARDNNYAFCWTSNGQVLLRQEEGSKGIVIRDEEQLQAMTLSA